MLGREALLLWKASILAAHRRKPFGNGRKIPPYINLNVLGQTTAVRIPSADLGRMYQELGVHNGPVVSVIKGVPAGVELAEPETIASAVRNGGYEFTDEFTWLAEVDRPRREAIEQQLLSYRRNGTSQHTSPWTKPTYQVIYPPRTG